MPKLQPMETACSRFCRLACHPLDLHFGRIPPASTVGTAKETDETEAMKFSLIYPKLSMWEVLVLLCHVLV